MPHLAHRNRLSRSASIGLLVVGLLPFLIGANLQVSGGHLDAVSLPCPFREATGLPCPLCGSTRAVVLASHLDAGFGSYNAVMVAVLLGLAGLGLAGLLVSRRPGAGLRLPATRWLVAGGVTTVAVLWSWTLVHHSTIVS